MFTPFGSIMVEGLIGAGKSTFALALAQALNGEFIPEPDESSNPFLTDYYTQPERYAFTMQVYLLSARYRAHQYVQAKLLHQRNGFCIMDRSYFGDACFARIQKTLGFFDKREYDAYFRLHKDMATHILYPTIAVFLKASPEQCQKRISQRILEKTGRKCEEAISLEYLKNLDAEIDVLAQEMATRTRTIIVDYDANLTPKEIKEKALQLAQDILSYDHSSEHEAWTGIGGLGA